MGETLDYYISNQNLTIEEQDIENGKIIKSEKKHKRDKYGSLILGE